MLRLLFVLTLHTSAGPEHPSGDRWFAPDKAKHFFIAAFVQSVGFSAARATGLGQGPSLAAASATTAVVSIGKEMRDAQTGGEVSIRDLVWDAAGGAAATLALRHTVH